MIKTPVVCRHVPNPFTATFQRSLGDVVGSVKGDLAEVSAIQSSLPGTRSQCHRPGPATRQRAFRKLRIIFRGCSPLKPDIAGYPVEGRWKICFKGKGYYRARLIFLYLYGYMPEEVDHQDNDPLNDRPSNLRAATHIQNAANQKGSSSNSTWPVAHVCGRLSQLRVLQAFKW